MRSKLLVILTVLAAVLALSVGAVLAMGASNGNDGTSDSQATAQEATPTPNQDAPPWMGVVVKPADSGNGLVIASVVPDGPAAKAGLAEGDTITAVDGTATKTPDELKTAIVGHKDGDEITIAVIKKDASNNETTDVKVTLVARPAGKSIGGPGDLQNIIGKSFDRFLGGSFKYLDDNGKTIEVEVVPGKVTSITDSQIKIDVNGDEGERTFDLSDDAKVPDGLAQGDRAVVVLENGTVKAVTEGAFPLLPFAPGGLGGPFHGGLPKLCSDGEGLFPGLDEICPQTPAPTPAASPQA